MPTIMADLNSCFSTSGIIMENWLQLVLSLQHTFVLG